jgi:hypothetical protein
MALKVFNFQTLNSPATVKYRAGVTAADSTTVAPTTFTGGSPVPVIPATGQPNLYVTARFTANTDTIGVTPVALNIDNQGTVTVLALGIELTLSCAATPLTDGTLYYSNSQLATAWGPRSSQSLGAGPITHVAWLVTTAPSSSHATDLYAWLSG